MNESALLAPRTRSPGAIYLVLILVQAVSASGLTTIYTTLPSLYREYAGASGVGWAVTSYLLFSASGSALCGRLGDLLGRRRVMLTALVIAGSGAVLSALAPTLAGLIVGCALQGLAGSLTPLDIGLARETLPARHVPLAVGIIGAAGIVGAGVTYVFAGWVTDHFASHGAFLMKTGHDISSARLFPSSMYNCCWDARSCWPIARWSVWEWAVFKSVKCCRCSYRNRNGRMRASG